MDIAEGLKTAVRLMRQHKIFWVWGIFLTMGSLLGAVVRLLLQNRFDFDPEQIGAWLTDPASSPIGSILLGSPEALVGSVVTFFLLAFVGVTGLWLLLLWADAALIAGTQAALAETAVSFWQMARQGGRRVGQFVAIDALVFLPWFLLSLIILFLINGVAVGTAVTANNAQSALPIGILLVGLLCLLPLLCLLIPLGVGSALLRLLAFRDAMLLDHSVRQSVRHVWQQIKQNPLAFLLVAGVVWGIQTLTRWLLTAANSFSIFSQFGGQALDWQFNPLSIVGTLLFLAATAISILIHAFIAVFWTVMYAQSLEGEGDK